MNFVLTETMDEKIIKILEMLKLQIRDTEHRKNPDFHRGFNEGIQRAIDVVKHSCTN